MKLKFEDLYVGMVVTLHQYVHHPHTMEVVEIGDDWFKLKVINEAIEITLAKWKVCYCEEVI